MKPVAMQAGGHPVNLVEVEIRGFIRPRGAELPSWTADRPVVAEDVIAAIDGCEAAALLLRIDSGGGCIASTLATVQALDRYRARGGFVVAYLERAWSAAPLLAVAADTTVLAPGLALSPDCSKAAQRIILHAPVVKSYEVAEATHRLVAAELAARSRVTERTLFAWTLDQDRARGVPPGDTLRDVPPEAALALRLVDRIGSLEDARRAAADGRGGASAAAAVDWTKISAGQSNTANLWPNPTSELEPPTGADTTSPEWAYRTSIGDAPAGSYVRQIPGGNAIDLWVPAVAGDSYLFQAVARILAGSTAYANMEIAFYQADKSTLVGAATAVNATTTTWTLKGPITAAAPAGAVWVRFRLTTTDASTTAEFDQIFASRMVSVGMLTAACVTTDALAAGAVTASKVASDVLQTADWADDGSGNPAAGARMISASAAPAWASGTTYASGAMVSSAGDVYRSLQASNTNHTPASSPTWWKKIPTLQVEAGGLQIGAYVFSQRFEATQLTLPALSSSVTWTFSAAEPDTNYLVIVTAVNSWNAPTPNCQVVVSAIKNTGSLQIITAGQPNAGGGVLFDVVKFRI